MDAGIAAADTLEKQITKRISEVYGDALKAAIKQNKQFFKKLQDIDSGKIKPPAFYDTPEKIAKWREGYIRELMRTEHVTESITQQIKDAGAAVSPEIEKELAGVYAANANYTAQKLTRMKANAPSAGLISSVTRKQAAIIIKDKQPLFSKIAFNNLQNAPAVVKRLQNEMLQASLLGESQQQIIKRIQAVMNNSAKNAKRIAQTERTRLQSQARNDKLKEAEDAGVAVMKEWSCAMMATSRESHIALDGKRVKMGEKFRTIWGNDLEFPGDPNAPAKEVINCHCVMVPDVATEAERAKEDTENGETRLKRSPENGIIETRESTEAQAEIAAKIADEFRYVDEWGDEHCPIDQDSFAAMSSTAQENAAAGIHEATRLLNLKQLPRKIAFGNARNAYGSYNEANRTLTLSRFLCKDPAEAYSTMIHELTHYYDHVSGNISEKVYKQALKEMGLKTNSRKAKNLLIGIVGIGYAEEERIHEALPFSVEKVLKGSQNELALKIFEIITR